MEFGQTARTIQGAIDHALNYFNHEHELRLIESDLNVNCWPQTWANTGCGFGGISGQMITTAPTVVITNDVSPIYALVYHGGRLAYRIDVPSDYFWQRFHGHDMPGATKYGDIARMRK